MTFSYSPNATSPNLRAILDPPDLSSLGYGLANLLLFLASNVIRIRAGAAKAVANSAGIYFEV